MLSKRSLALCFALLCLPASVAEARTHGCSVRYHCHARHRSGRVLSPVLAPQPALRQPPLPRPDFAPRPVQPGRTPPVDFQQNHLPPVFAPQPLK